MTIFVTWQLRVTVDSIRNSCDVFLTCFFVSLLYKENIRNVLCSLRHSQLMCQKSGYIDVINKFRHHNFWTYRYFFCELLAFVNVVGDCNQSLTLTLHIYIDSIYVDSNHNVTLITIVRELIIGKETNIHYTTPNIEWCRLGQNPNFSFEGFS